MRFFNEAPFVRLLVPVLAGIISAVYFIQNEFFLITGACISLAALIVTLSIKLHTKLFKYAWIGGIAINLALFFLAAELTLKKTEIRNTDHFSKHLIKSNYVSGHLIGSPVEKEKTFKCVFEITNVFSGDHVIQTSGKCMVYLQKDSLAKRLNYGDEIVLASKFKDIPSPQNPGEFNYKRYLQFHNIHQQAYIKSKEWWPTGNNNGNALMKHVSAVRNNLLRKIEEVNLKSDEFAVAAALILGYSDHLDAEIISAYSSTGALHVLSVSGLHVGLIYIVFNFLFVFFERFKHGKITKGMLIIVLLWIYAALTGLSPSVLRSATMFTFIVLGQSLKRTTNIYNTLAVSCFVLLLFNPFLIFEVGFQLSYLAVLGIVALQPMIYNWWQTEVKLFDWIWKVTSVSIAAQLATFPLGFLYFHQFPNYFLLSNLIVIPISTIIIYNGILFFILGSVPFMGPLLVKTLEFFLLFLNGSVKYMERLPYALMQGISISVIETILIYTFLISTIVYVIKKTIIPLRITLSLAVILLVINLYEKTIRLQQRKLVVYDIPNTTGIDIMEGQQNYFFSDSALVSNKNKMLFYVKHNWWNNGIERCKLSARSDSSWLTQSNAFTTLYLTNSDMLKKVTLKRVNYLILSNDCDVAISDIANVLDFDLLIFTSGNSRKKIRKWEEQCKMLNRKYHNVGTQGAFATDI